MRKAVAFTVVLSTLLGAFVALSAPATAGSSQQERFVLNFNAVTGPGTISAAGIFNDSGTAIAIHPIEWSNTVKYDVVFPEFGGFTLSGNGDGVGSGWKKSNCKGYFFGQTPYQLSNGYGRYSGISGNGTIHISGGWKMSPNADGVCKISRTPQSGIVWKVHLRAQGPASLPAS
jgi:hypothetical protein